MKITYAAALKRVLSHEGGYANHPDDPGGPTMRGVTQRVYDGFRKSRNLPKRSVREISELELQAIYRVQYWDVIRGDRLPSGVDLAVFDAAVNSGPTQAARWLQRALGVSPVDGQIGNVTLEACEDADPVEIARSICDQRIAFLRRLKTWRKFGGGWTRRVDDVRQAATALAQGARPEKPIKLDAEETGKGLPSDTATTSTPAGNTAAKGILGTLGAMVAYGAEKLDGLSEKIGALAGVAPEAVKYALAGIVVVSFAGVLIAGAMTLYDVARRKAAGEAMEAP